MMKKIFSVLGSGMLAMFFCAAPGHAIGVGVEASAGWHQVTPWGNLSYKGTALDVKNDLNYGTLNTYLARVKLNLPLFLPNLYLTANPMKFEGTGTRAIPFAFGNVASFNANVPFDSSLKLDHYDLTLFYNVPGLSALTTGILNVELGVNIRYIDLKAEIRQPQTGLTESKSLAIPVPMGYAGVRVSPFGFFDVEGDIQAIGYGGNRYYDVGARAKFKPIPFVYVAPGYSFQNITIDQSDVKTDLQFGGPTLEIGVEF